MNENEPAYRQRRFAFHYASALRKIAESAKHRRSCTLTHPETEALAQGLHTLVNRERGTGGETNHRVP